MIRYARDDTHYLLYIYDKVREALWEKGNEQPTQLQVVWQRSKDICLKVKLHLLDYLDQSMGLVGQKILCLFYICCADIGFFLCVYLKTAV